MSFSLVCTQLRLNPQTPPHTHTIYVQKASPKCAPAIEYYSLGFSSTFFIFFSVKYITTKCYFLTSFFLSFFIILLRERCSARINITVPDVKSILFLYFCEKLFKISLKAFFPSFPLYEPIQTFIAAAFFLV